jgi:hypothetical protein
LALDGACDCVAQDPLGSPGWITGLGSY